MKLLKYAPPPSEGLCASLEGRAQTPYVSTSIPTLDRCLQGGLSCGWLVEVYGERATGKSQLCFHIAAQALNAGRQVFWLDSEKSFRPDRILLMCTRPDSINRLHTCAVDDLNQLIDHLSVLRKFCQSTSEISEIPLIVIDSIAGIARRTFLSGATRQNLLHEAALLIKGIRAATIAVNHLIGTCGAVTPNAEAPKAFLGKLWSDDVTCSFFLSRDESSRCGPRALQLIKNVYESDEIILFEINDKGIRIL